jgi:uncharacterized SAM-binding protein YcdF (DUF218 family)
VNKADVIVVLGGGPGRIQQAIALYQEKLANELWHTGDVLSFGENTSYARIAAQLAVEQGVPSDAIHLLATTSTWEDGQAIAALAEERQVRSILVVTDWTHSRRALSVVRAHLAESEINVYYVPSTNSLYDPDNWWRHKLGRTEVLSELVKIGVYWWRYGVVAWRD